MKKKMNLLCKSEISYTEIGSDNPEKDTTYHVWKWNGFNDVLLHYVDDNLLETITGELAKKKVKQLI